MDISIFGIGSVAAITVLCYLVGSGAKTTPLDNKYIPVICGCTCLLYTSPSTMLQPGMFLKIKMHKL